MSFSCSMLTVSASGSGSEGTAAAAALATTGRSISGTTAARRRCQATKPAPSSANRPATAARGSQGKSSPGASDCGMAVARGAVAGVGSARGVAGPADASSCGGGAEVRGCAGLAATGRCVTVGRGLGTGVGPAAGTRVVCAVGRAVGAACVADGVGVVAGVGVGVGVFTARGAMGTPARVSAGPCACGVAEGVGTGSSEKSLTDCACAIAGSAAARAIRERRVGMCFTGDRFAGKGATVRSRAE